VAAMKVGETRQGTRVKRLKKDWSNLVEGAYAKLPNGDWAIHPPGGHYGTISPSVHTITEHDDGTVTMSPSILYHASGTFEGWHGYLEKGVWRRI
jgi:hypothetical protein